MPVGGASNLFYTPDRLLTDAQTGISHHFDFSYYMQTTGAVTPNFVVIQLGANDGCAAASVQNLGVMVRSIQSYDDSVGKPITVLLATEYLKLRRSTIISFLTVFPTA